MLRPYFPLEDSVSVVKSSSDAARLSPQQADAIKRVLVYSQNYRDENANDALKAISVARESLEKEIANALQANVALDSLYSTLGSKNPKEVRQVIASSLDKVGGEPELSGTKQAFYAGQIKTLSACIRLPGAKSEAVSAMSDTILDYLAKYQNAGGNVSDEVLLKTFQLPLGTYGKYKQACKDVENTQEATVAMSPRPRR